MSDFSFRIRVTKSPRDTVNIEDHAWEVNLGSLSLILRSREKDLSIKDAKVLVAVSAGWQSKEQAEEAGNKCLHALMRTLACLRVGADYGLRASASFITDYGFEMLAGQAGGRVLRDVHGLMVFETLPPPRFAALGDPSVIRGTPRERFERALNAALAQPEPLSERELVSLQLFNASFFQDSPDTRFLLLVMATEALLEFQPRSTEAVDMVDTFISTTRDAQSLTESERQSLIGSLSWLRTESINQAGRRLASERLPGRVYDGQPAPAFFSRCYDIRSRLVHGQVPIPTRAETGMAAAHMETFVADLLSGQLLNVIWPLP